MNDEIKSAAAEVAVRQSTIAEAAVAMFASHEAAARTLAERYRGVVWDVAEPRGMREALELIAAPKRPDGTWNRDRAACQQIAAEALAKEEQR